MNTFIRTISALVAACLLLTFSAYAQKPGSTAMQFLHVMPCARGTALGDAYSVMSSGAEAVFWNPSGVALTQHQQLSSTFVSWIFDTKQGALSYATPLGGLGSVGFQIQYVDFGEIEETSLDRPYIKNLDEPGMTGRTFHPYSYLIGATYASNLTDRFSTGLSIKFAHESLFSEGNVTTMVSQGIYQSVNTWANGLMFDFGVHYNTGYRTVQIGATVQNFGPNVKYATESNPVPLLFRFGIVGDLIGADALLYPTEGDNRLSLAFDLFQPNDYTQQQHVGVEYEFAHTFALRAGYKFNYDSEGLTLGAGIKQNLGSVNFSFDYSYGSMSYDLGAVQRISLGAELP